jgi:hypothetical protein
MTRYSHPSLTTWPLLLGLALSWSAAAQPLDASSEANARLSTEQVVINLVQKNIERARALVGFHGTRTYRLEYRGFPGSRSAEMIVDVNFLSPATKEFTIRSATGSKLIIDRVFKRMLQGEKEALTDDNQSRVALNNENYRFTAAGYESTPGHPLYVLAVEPRTKNKFLYRGRIWVDAIDFAVVRIEAEPAKNPSFWTKETKIEQVYSKIGDFWLPLSNRSATTVRLGGHADFSIDYKDYQITAATPASKTESAVAGHR